MEDDVLNFWAEMVKRVYGTRLVARLRLRAVLSALGVPPELLPPALLPVVVWSATFYQKPAPSTSAMPAKRAQHKRRSPDT